MDAVLKTSTGYIFWYVCSLKNGLEKCQNMAKLSPKKVEHLNIFLIGLKTSKFFNIIS
jgi:hypothetical protein